MLQRDPQVQELKFGIHFVIFCRSILASEIIFVVHLIGRDPRVSDGPSSIKLLGVLAIYHSTDTRTHAHGHRISFKPAMEKEDERETVFGANSRHLLYADDEMNKISKLQ